MLGYGHVGQGEVMTTRRTALVVGLAGALCAARPALGAPSFSAPTTGASVPLVAPLQRDQQAPELRLVQALNTAWNAGDLDGVLAAFADGAQIRQKGAHLAFYGPNVQVDDVYGTSVSYFGESPATDDGDLVWARGKVEIASWAAPFLAVDRKS